MTSHIRSTLLATLNAVASNHECVTRAELLQVADEIEAIPALAALAARIRSAATRLERLPVSAILADYDAHGIGIGCSGARGGKLHGWVCLRPAVDRVDGVGLVRVTCSQCGHQFEVEYTGSLGGRMFPVPEHAPGEIRIHEPAHVRELAGRPVVDEVA